MEGRRGFLIGAAKLIGAGMTLAAVPSGLANAAAPLLWTPDKEVVPVTEFNQHQVSAISRYGALLITVSRFENRKEILRWGVAPGGILDYSPAFGREIVFGDGERLERITISVDIL